MKLAVLGRKSLALIPFLIPASFAQQPEPPSPALPTFRVQSSMVLIDVISRDRKTGLPVRDFKKEDFRVLDNKHEVPVSSLDGEAHDTRPVALWLVLLCNEQKKVGGSADFVGDVALFRPALDHLEEHDAVGVAHWCDNGETRLDLLPTHDHDIPVPVLAKTIRPVSYVWGNDFATGEDAFRRVIRLIIQDAHRRNPQPLPVIVFLDGDSTGQPREQLDQVVDDFLETSGIVFGIKDSMAPQGPLPHNGEIGEIEHYMADQTGGEYFSTSPSGYAVALDAILMQLHFRYELGFIPPAIDGKRHGLKVELTKDAAQNHKGARLRYRPEYIPLKEAPAWAR